MPFTQLDTQAALILIDLQRGITKMAATATVTGVIQHAAALAAAFRARNLPVVLVRVTGTAPGRTQRTRPPATIDADFAEFVPELDHKPSDMVIEKRSYGAFLGTPLDGELRRIGVTHLVMGGIATSIGVESTARSAYDLRYNISFVADAMADLSPEAHQHSVERIFPRLGEVGSTADMLALLPR